MVERRHLVDVLRRGARGPVTLMSAPAGFGKTVLVSAWMSLIDGSVPVAHLTMREDDESPAVFWASAMDALRDAGIDVSDVPAPAASEGIDRPMLTGLIRSINAHEGPVVWVLDCGEFSLDQSVGAGLHRIVERCHEDLHLVLLTRADPPLPLHRYRLAGDLTEIRAADLVFTASEASTLLQRAGLDLAPLDAVMLRSRTGGWPAGLQFAALTLAGRVDVDQAIREFRGDSGNVAAFLMTEVYAKQPQSIQEFLLRTCVVDELSPGLAAALTGQADAAAVLQFVAHGNVFVEPVPGKPGCYRYQSLFREFLHSQLSFEHPELNRVLHRAAAEQLAGEGQVLASLQHAVAAGAWSLATRTLVDGLWVGGLLVGGYRSVLRDLFAWLPRDAEGAQSAVTRAALALVERDSLRCDMELAKARDLLEEDPETSRGACALAASVLDAVSAGLGDDVDGALDRILAAETALQSAPPETRQRHPDLSAILAQSKATVLVERGELGTALKTLDEGMAAAAAPHLGDALGELQGTAALAHALNGGLRQAARIVARLAPGGVEEGAGSASVPRSALAALAWVRLNEYDLEDAHVLIRTATEHAPAYDSTVPDSVLALLQSRLYAAEGELDLARSVLRTGRDHGDAGPASGWLGREHLLSDARLLLAKGSPGEAAAVAREVKGPQQLERDLVLVRALQAAGHETDVLLEPSARTLERLPLEVQVDTWLALAEQSVRTGDQDRGDACLERALHLAAPERLRRPFVEATGEVRAMLDRRNLVSRTRWLQLRHAQHSEHALRSGDGWEQTPLAEPDASRHEHLVNPLTKKELEVLGHLAQLLTTEEIADTMYVSVNTVRSHVRNILRKLGVARRNEAVRRAWELQILPPSDVA
jgi:LuxR family maltose regulon positive regulatory protein